MSKDAESRISPEIVDLVIEIISEQTGLPTIVINNNDLPERVEKSSSYFTDFCKEMHRLGFYERCLTDHKERAKECLRPTKQFCWMGLRNYAYPIIISEKKEATILYGQCRSDDTYNNDIGIVKFRKALELMPLNNDTKEYLANLYDKIKKVNDATTMIDGKGPLSKLVKWFGTAVSELFKIQNTVFRVTHELANYTTGVYTSAWQFLDLIDTDDTEINIRGKELLNSLKRLRTVIDNIGGFLGPYSYSRCDIKIEIEKAIEIYTSVAEAKGIDFVVYTIDKSNFPIVNASKKHLEIVFNNLIANAIKYSHTGFHRDANNKMTVDIRGHKDGSIYIVEIQNFGVGILQEEIDSGKIFDAGYQGELTKNEYRDGGGYGLTMTKEIIDNHNFKISIESKNVGGDAYLTTVYLFFADNKEAPNEK
jgi:ligand-binding sensor protein